MRFLGFRFKLNLEQLDFGADRTEPDASIVPGSNVAAADIDDRSQQDDSIVPGSNVLAAETEKYLMQPDDSLDVVSLKRFGSSKMIGLLHSKHQCYTGCVVEDRGLFNHLTKELNRIKGSVKWKIENNYNYLDLDPFSARWLPLALDTR